MRKRRAEIRKTTPDVRHGSELVAKLINTVMRSGKRSTAEAIVYGAFALIHERTKQDPFKTFQQAMEKIRPDVEVKSRRVGGATYQVPIEVDDRRGTSLSLRWLVQYARGRSERGMHEQLAAEILDAASSRGNAVKKREDVHRMAEANRAFAHYRW
ncbi:MAG: 30S ribosomal protein S7 [Acidobacteriota bacterium]|nr:MAG: 30S ribosomal protein S7 [Acidobacteriota bacterium]